ncbi:hypothetical protein BDK51DRAFT_46365 [Blyttiomyces helicus]|uniref:Uncharacterized protein n=1 Tax=Blyttiomyces helicus TaxID=388810 RepID=A0A4P9WEQ2_9FUNG|nr:hypothetical protein BDK51DRAFT_46365 [Blyttiomyces helicus]|eukprot:RKO90275.1 hypothetical protein BDK51DRAFT_46365 [Blyttiomyces helicus]
MAHQQLSDASFFEKLAKATPLDVAHKSDTGREVSGSTGGGVWAQKPCRLAVDTNGDLPPARPPPYRPRKHYSVPPPMACTPLDLAHKSDPGKNFSVPPLMAYTPKPSLPPERMLTPDSWGIMSYPRKRANPLDFMASPDADDGGERAGITRPSDQSDPRVAELAAQMELDYIEETMGSAGPDFGAKARSLEVTLELSRHAWRIKAAALVAQEDHARTDPMQLDSPPPPGALGSLPAAGFDAGPAPYVSAQEGAPPAPAPPASRTVNRAFDKYISLPDGAPTPFDTHLAPTTLQECIAIIESDAHQLPHDRTPVPTLAATLATAPPRVRAAHAEGLKIAQRRSPHETRIHAATHHAQTAIAHGALHAKLLANPLIRLHAQCSAGAALPPDVRSAEDLLAHIAPDVAALQKHLVALQRNVRQGVAVASHAVGELSRLRRASFFTAILGVPWDKAVERAETLGTVVDPEGAAGPLFSREAYEALYGSVSEARGEATLRPKNRSRGGVDRNRNFYTGGGERTRGRRGGGGGCGGSGGGGGGGAGNGGAGGDRERGGHRRD